MYIVVQACGHSSELIKVHTRDCLNYIIIFFFFCYVFCHVIFILNIKVCMCVCVCVLNKCK